VGSQKRCVVWRNNTSRHRTIEIYHHIQYWLEGTYTLRIVTSFVELFLNIAPYLVISIALNVAATRYFRTRPIQFSSKSEFIAIVSAALIGLVSPLPTYAAIPIGLSLMASGIPFSAIMAFVISSPLMNPTVFFLTATQVGLEMAVARTVAAFILAVLGGLLTVRVFKDLYRGAPIGSQPSERPARSLKSEILGNTKYILKYFSIALLLSAAVKALVPPGAVTAMLGGNAKVSTLVAIGMGVPFYTCGGSAIPFMQTLMGMGMSKGAMLAFFLSGPATKLETLYAYKTMLGMKALIFFLSLTLVFSYAAGLFYSMI
jgi:uncharacterized membrane protein YraQ (UPF0718 family)